MLKINKYMENKSNYGPLFNLLEQADRTTQLECFERADNFLENTKRENREIVSRIFID